MGTGTGPASVLLVEDDLVDAEAVFRGFRKRGWSIPVHRAADGIEALERLRVPGDEVGALEQPCLVLLDLNMPRMGGIEMLSELRADRRLSGCVVIVLTTSSAERDRVSAQRLDVAGYFVKSRSFDEFGELAEFISTLRFERVAM